MVDDGCAAGAATYKTLFLNSLKESLNHVVDDSCTAGAATYKTLFSVGMAGASGGWKSSRSFCQVLEIYIFQTLYLPFILLYMYSYGIKE